MTLERARELIAIQVDLGTSYNRGAIGLILGEVGRQFDQQTVDALIDEFSLGKGFGLKKGKVYHQTNLDITITGFNNVSVNV